MRKAIQSSLNYSGDDCLSHGLFQNLFPCFPSVVYNGSFHCSLLSLSEERELLWNSSVSAAPCLHHDEDCLCFCVAGSSNPFPGIKEHFRARIALENNLFQYYQRCYMSCPKSHSWKGSKAMGQTLFLPLRSLSAFATLW